MKKIFTKQNRSTWLHIALLALLVLVAYSKVFHATFIDWDDGEYVINNKDIRGFSFQHLAAWWSLTHFYVGNFQPMAMLSYTIDYLFGGLSPFIYHFTNILLHIASAAAVYFFINRLQSNKMVGLFVALIFAMHPSQTESVSWIAERKTTLCALFYFTSLWAYTFYAETPSVKKYIPVFLLGLAAMLSKGVGVVLPLSLFAVDIWKHRSLAQRNVWLEKVPLLVCSVAVGLIAIRGQEAAQFLGMHDRHSSYSWFETLVLAGYAYVQYIIHFFLPVRLSFIYPYPQALSFVHYLYFALALGIAALVFISYRRKWVILCGSIVFYTVNIALLLQIIQFGEVLMADRYLYIAGVGILFPAVYFLFGWLRKAGKQVVAVAAGSVVVLIFFVMTFMRNDAWLSDFNFFSSILDQYPTSVTAQYSIGGLYLRAGNYAEAEKHIDYAIRLEPGNYKAWYNKAVLCRREGRLPEALDALSRCLAIQDYYKAYFTRAMIYQEQGRPAAAISDIDRVLDEQPGNARAYFIKAGCMEQEGNAPDALENYSKAIYYDNKDPLFYIRRGLMYGRTRQNQPALNDLDTAVALSHGSGEALYFRGIIKYHAGQDPCADFRGALSMGYKQAQDAIARVCNRQ